jgi:hypothetical protein
LPTLYVLQLAQLESFRAAKVLERPHQIGTSFH